MQFALVVSILFATWTAGIDAALGRSGSMQLGNVYKVSFPRSDLDVVAGNVHLKPALALGSWAAFIPTKSGTMTMGDLVLTEGEVNDVITTLQHGGIEQTAVHNHLLGESPRVVYVHFGGHGDAVALARTLHDALARTKTPPPSPSAPAAAVDLPNLDAILGATGKANGGVMQYAIPRKSPVTEHGITIPPAAGVATAINFQPTGNGRAATTGDFVMIAGEVNPVIRELRDGGIAVTALHSHMLDEQPRLFFMHFWAEGDATALAKTLRKALDRMSVK
jgi:hypothetical protein